MARASAFGMQSPRTDSLFDFTVRATQPVKDGLLVYFTAGETPGRLPQLECLMHLRPRWLFWTISYSGCSERDTNLIMAKLNVSGYQVPQPENQDGEAGQIYGLVDHDQAKQILIIFADGSQQTVPIQTRGFIGLIPMAYRMVQVKSLNKDGQVIGSWAVPP
ncbi:MAG: hypothetical protein NT075_24860 [Chloroflexi bacterium]|nr:hypothetical protein [Chloroflexota bacterium]